MTHHLEIVSLAGLVVALLVIWLGSIRRRLPDDRRRFGRRTLLK